MLEKGITLVELDGDARGTDEWLHIQLVIEDKENEWKLRKLPDEEEVKNLDELDGDMDGEYICIHLVMNTPRITP